MNVHISLKIKDIKAIDYADARKQAESKIQSMPMLAATEFARMVVLKNTDGTFTAEVS